MGARPAGQAGPRRRQQGVLAHQAQHAAFRGPDAGDAQPRPDLVRALAMEGAVVKHAADLLYERGIGDRPSRPRATRQYGRRRHAVPVDGGAGHSPDPADAGDAIGYRAAGRGRTAHGLDLRRAKGRPACRAVILASRSSRSSSISPSRALRRAFQFLAVGGARGKAGLASGEEGLSPAAQRRGRDAKRVRDRLQILAAQQPQHGVTLALPRHPPAAAGRRYASILHALRGARPLCPIHRHSMPLPRIPSACRVSQSTVGGGLHMILCAARLITCHHDLPP